VATRTEGQSEVPRFGLGAPNAPRERRISLVSQHENGGSIGQKSRRRRKRRCHSTSGGRRQYNQGCTVRVMCSPKQDQGAVAHTRSLHRPQQCDALPRTRRLWRPGRGHGAAGGTWLLPEGRRPAALQNDYPRRSLANGVTIHCGRSLHRLDIVGRAALLSPWNRVSDQLSPQ
jgi:hypothetical protein